MDTVIFEVWYIGPEYEYPLLDVVTAILEYRNEVINIDRKVVEATCDRRNFLACEDERYEIRELTREQYDNLPKRRLVRRRA